MVNTNTTDNQERKLFMNKIKLKLLIENLKGANYAQIAKNDSKKFLKEVKRNSQQAVLSNNANYKNAVIMANMNAIETLVEEELSMIDSIQNANLNISEIIVRISRLIDGEEDGDQDD